MTDINVITKDRLGPRPKLEGGKSFVMDTDFDPAGDQPTAISELSAAILGGERNPNMPNLTTALNLLEVIDCMKR